MWPKAVLLCCLCCLYAEGVIEEHRVLSLPGASTPLKSKWYSGSLHSGKKPGTGINLYYHYTFIESHSSNPEKDPVLLWTNGGPGAASLWGLFTELGPFYLSSTSLKTYQFNTTGIPTLYRKPQLILLSLS